MCKNNFTNENEFDFSGVDNETNFDIIKKIRHELWLLRHPVTEFSIL